MNMMQWVARSTVAVVFVAAGAMAQAADLQEGKDFRRLDKPQPVETGKKIEVIEFFSFSCPHCKDIEPILSAWVKKLPADVQFRRIPVQFSPAWTGTSKVWYTLEGLNEERLIPAVFNALHGQNVRLDQDKVFFDWSQNVAAKTTISPYSLRGRELPCAAAPRTWDEVEAGAAKRGGIEQVMIDDMLERIGPGGIDEGGQLLADLP